MDLSKDERFLLEWLSKEDYSQYGECCGKSLDGLVTKGLAIVHGDGGVLGDFVAQGSTPSYNSVSLTTAGRAALQNIP